MKYFKSLLLIFLLAGCTKPSFDYYPKALSDAKDFISSTYPEAAALPAVIDDNPDAYYAYYREGVGYYSIRLAAKGSRILGCAMVHEYEHHKWYMEGNHLNADLEEQVALEAGYECLRKFKVGYL